MVNPKLNYLAVTTLALLCAASLLPGAAAAAAAFNTFPVSYTPQTDHDLPLLDARNASVSGSAFSVSQADHDNGVQAEAGQEAEFQIYYHNGAANETNNIAHNVVIRAILPGGTQQSHEVSASITSDQTTAVSSSATGRGGNMIVHINGQPQTLTFIPGSVRWFPNHSTTAQFPANGDSLVTSAGLNIGDVQGCFEFSGFVNFRARVGAQAAANYGLDIQKRVLNVSRSESIYQSSTNASPSERVRFEVKVATSGNASQNNVFVRDALPSQLALVNGSLQQNGGNVASTESEFFGSNGKNFGALSPGTTQTFVFDATVAGSGSFSGATTLTNIAYAKSDQVSQKQADARVNVEVTAVNNDLAITKRVLNATRNESSYQSSTNAAPGERVRFEVKINASGSSTQNNVIVRDILPTSQLNLVAGTLQLNGTNASNMESDFLGSGRNIGSRSPGASDVFVFDALVAGSGAFSGTITTVINTSNVRSDQVGTRQAEARVNVQLQANVQFQLRKTAFNLTQGVDATSVPANPGNSIVYTLYFKNTGNTQLSGIVIEDNIQDILQLAQITDQGGAVSVNGSIKYSPVDIPAGVEVSRSFTVRVRPANEFVAGHDSVMTNIYGNEVRVLVRVPAVAGAVTPAKPPRTGPGEWLMGLLASFTTFGYFLYRKQKTA